jgi:uncharacterized protein
MVTKMNNTLLSQFSKQKYLNLETFRKNGNAVQTPVWFVESNGMLYVRTLATSGKVKRIRNISQVRVMPCQGNGKPLGKWVEARANLVDEFTAQQINHLFTKKYGLIKILFELLGGSSRKQQATIALQLIT